MLRKISLFFFPIIFFVLIYQYQKSKHYSWDLTAYVAEVLKLDSPKDLHLDTYKTLSVSLPKERYNHLTNFEYGKTNLENKKIFYEQLRFYDYRILYHYTNHFIRIVTGVSVPNAIFLNSALFAFLSVCLLFYISYKEKTINLFLSGLIIVNLIMQKEFIEIIRFSTPDAQSIFLVSLSIYLFFKNSSKSFFIVALLSLLVRSDNVILYTLLILFDLIINRQNLFRKTAYLVGLVTFYLLLNKVFEVPSYGVLFKHTFLSPVLYPVSNSESFHLSEYIVFLKKQITGILSISMILVTSMLYLGYQSKDKTDYRLLIFGISIFIVYHLKYILFPIYWYRFYALYLVLFLIFIVFYLKKNSYNVR